MPITKAPRTIRTATAQKGENPTTEKFTVEDISMEFTRWKRKPKADQ